VAAGRGFIDVHPGSKGSLPGLKHALVSSRKAIIAFPPSSEGCGAKPRDDRGDTGEDVDVGSVGVWLVITPAFFHSSICFSVLNPDQLSILQPELHCALQTAALNGLFDRGVVFGLQFSLLGCDRGVNGNFWSSDVAAVPGAGTGAGCDSCILATAALVSLSSSSWCLASRRSSNARNSSGMLLRDFRQKS
jgi:hypothetical protein